MPFHRRLSPGLSILFSFSVNREIDRLTWRTGTIISEYHDAIHSLSHSDAPFIEMLCNGARVISRNTRVTLLSFKTRNSWRTHMTFPVFASCLRRPGAIPASRRIFLVRGGILIELFCWTAARRDASCPSRRMKFELRTLRLSHAD